LKSINIITILVCMHKVAIIGSGFSSLAAASVLAKAGYQVDVFEKNDSLGGRARQFKDAGFTFDMGPSWYWMPDVFERFFNQFGKTVSDYYELKRLDPAYSIFFDKNDIVEIPDSANELHSLFENIEKGSSIQLALFMAEAAYKYEVGMKSLVYKPGRSVLEFADLRFLKGLAKMHVFQSFHKYVRKFFADRRLLSVMEFPVLFLGGTPENTPALYSLMNYAGLSLGTWYPNGGMHKIVGAMVELAESLDVRFHSNSEIEQIRVNKSQAVGLELGGDFHPADAVLAGADYHHVERNLLLQQHRAYSESYWDSRTMAPSSLIFYLGVNKRLKNLNHHNLFFDEDFAVHAHEIYEEPRWPSKPLFYVCCPSKTDDSVAPEGHENLFVLVPLAAGLSDSEGLRDSYCQIVMNRLEKLTQQEICSHIVFKRSYCLKDFKQDYHAFKGNAYGLANTLRQTAILKPSVRSKKVKNLFFAGQLTVPGPGVPPSIISGEVVGREIIKHLQN